MSIFCHSHEKEKETWKAVNEVGEDKSGDLVYSPRQSVWHSFWSKTSLLTTEPRSAFQSPHLTFSSLKYGTNSEPCYSVIYRSIQTAWTTTFHLSHLRGIWTSLSFTLSSFLSSHLSLILTKAVFLAPESLWVRPAARGKSCSLLLSSCATWLVQLSPLVLPISAPGCLSSAFSSRC